MFVALFFLAPNSPTQKRHTWVAVRSPHFVVISNANEDAARRTAIHFEQIGTVFREVLTRDAPPLTPLITVLALKNQGSLRSLLPQYWKGDHARPAGIFSHRLGQFYVAIDLSAPGPNPYATIYHEYLHSLPTPFLPHLPAWLAEGLADFYGNTRIDRLEASVGLPEATLLDELHRRPPLPFERLFQVDHSSPYYNDRDKTLLFHAESWAITDYLMVGDRGAHRHLLFEYIAKTEHGTNAIAAARAEFGSLAKLEMEAMCTRPCRASSPPRIWSSSGFQNRMPMSIAPGSWR